LTRTRSPSTMARSILAVRRPALAAAKDGSGTSLTESWFVVPAA
jgi:hypothetical protein